MSSADMSGGRVRRVVVVASWYPALDDTSRGRFVADQVAALQESGAEPLVVTFEPLRTRGTPAERGRQLAVARERIAAAVREARARAIAPGGWAVPAPVPVLRLPIVQRGDAGDPLFKLDARLAVLDPLVELLAPWGPDLVHAHTAYPDGAFAVRLADRLGVPLAVTEHASFLADLLADPPIRAEIEATAARAGVLMAVGGRLADQLGALGPDVAARVRIVPNPVDLDAYRPAPIADRVPDELLYVGYRSELKDIETLLRAFALVRAVRPGARLRLVGRSPAPELEVRWKAIADECGIADAVAFDPPALRSGVAAAMARASVLVHASRTETFGVVAIEALASGLPVVATATEGVAGTFRLIGGDPGALVPIGDPAALAAAVLEVLAARDRYDPGALRALVEPHFGFPVIAARTRDAYEAAATAWAARGPAISAVGTIQTPDAAPLPVSPADLEPTILVGLDRPRLARALTLVPDALQRRLVVVTTPAAHGSNLPLALEAVVEIDPDADFRDRMAGLAPGRGPRLLGLLRHPGRALARRRLRPRRDSLRAASATRLLASALDRLPGRSVVLLDAEDHLLAADAGLPVGSLAPGSLGWLVDRAVTLPAAAATGGASAAPGAPSAAPGAPAVRRIALYASADLNLIDGSSIWLESATATLARLPGASVTVLLRAPITRDVITARMARENVRLVRPAIPLADHLGRAQTPEAIEALEALDAEERFDLVVVRGYELCRHAVARGAFEGRLVATYVLEPERDLADPAYRSGLEAIAAGSFAIAVQTPEMAELLVDAVPAVADRLVMLPPGIPPELVRPPSWARDDRLLYVGKFHPFYAVDRIVEATVALRDAHPGLALEVAGDKLGGGGTGAAYQERLLELLRTTPGVTWHGGLARARVVDLLAEGGIGVSVWDYRHGAEMNDRVVSTKLLDYCASGIPVVVTPTRVLRGLLGADYPGFNPEVDTLPATLGRLLSDAALRESAATAAAAVAARFSYDAIARDLAAGLDALSGRPHRSGESVSSTP